MLLWLGMLKTSSYEARAEATVGMIERVKHFRYVD